MEKLTVINDLNIENRIFTLRGMQVMLDRDLAILYQVENRALKQAIKRNVDKFPDDFMFVLTDMEIDFMVSQNVIPSRQLKTFKESHDRFMIIDEYEVYHFGASLKDLGKKWFAFSKFDVGVFEMLGRLK